MAVVSLATAFDPLFHDLLSPAVSAKSQKTRATRMIKELRALGYRVEAARWAREAGARAMGARGGSPRDEREKREPAR
jgi:hypothetical protein